MYVAIFFDPLTNEVAEEPLPVVGENEKDVENRLVNGLQFEKVHSKAKGAIIGSWFMGRTHENKRIHAVILPSIAVGRLQEEIEKK